MLKYRVFRPGAGVVTWHKTLRGAQRSLLAQQRGAVAQGGYSRDYVEAFDGQNWKQSLFMYRESDIDAMEELIAGEERADLAELRGVSE
jgi:hypothetical protein